MGAQNTSEWDEQRKGRNLDETKAKGTKGESRGVGHKEGNEMQLN